MILKVEIKELLIKFVREQENYPSNWEQSEWLEKFADWLDELDIEKVIGK